MIVVDTNILAYLFLSSEWTPKAEALLAADPEWAVPVLWRSEFRNLLAGYMRREMLELPEAVALQREAEAMLFRQEHMVDSAAVMSLVAQSDCTAYDCEFIALAKQLGTSLVTMDRKLLRAFPDIARPLANA